MDGFFIILGSIYFNVLLKRVGVYVRGSSGSCFDVVVLYEVLKFDDYCDWLFIYWFNGFGGNILWVFY